MNNETRTRGRVRIVPMVFSFDGFNYSKVASVEGETNEKTGERRIRINSEIGEARVYPVHDFTVGPDPDGKEEQGRVYVELRDDYAGPADLWAHAEWPEAKKEEETFPEGFEHLKFDDPTRTPCFLRTVEEVAKTFRSGKTSPEDARELARTIEKPCIPCMLFQMSNPGALLGAVRAKLAN